MGSLVNKDEKNFTKLGKKLYCYDLSRRFLGEEIWSLGAYRNRKLDQIYGLVLL